MCVRGLLSLAPASQSASAPASTSTSTAARKHQGEQAADPLRRPVCPPHLTSQNTQNNHISNGTNVQSLAEVVSHAHLLALELFRQPCLSRPPIRPLSQPPILWSRSEYPAYLPTIPYFTPSRDTFEPEPRSFLDVHLHPNSKTDHLQALCRYRSRASAAMGPSKSSNLGQIIEYIPGMWPSPLPSQSQFQSSSHRPRSWVRFHGAWLGRCFFPRFESTHH